MKYSIIINPSNENSDAADHALEFIQALMTKQHHICHVFFYGYAVKYGFYNDLRWKEISEKGILLSACSTIAEKFKSESLSYIKLQGLGQWMDSVLKSDKTVEFA